MYIPVLRLMVVALLGACVSANDPELTVDSHTAAIQQESTVSDVAAEAVALYQELAARLESRGYTWEDALAAAEAGDEARARQLFGFTEEEFEAIGLRLEALAMAPESAHQEDRGAEDPDGPKCEREAASCAYQTLEIAIFRAAGVSWPLTIAYVAGGVGLCLWANCHWESGSGPATGRKQK